MSTLMVLLGSAMVAAVLFGWRWLVAVRAIKKLAASGRLYRGRTDLTFGDHWLVAAQLRLWLLRALAARFMATRGQLKPSDNSVGGYYSKTQWLLTDPTEDARAALAAQTARLERELGIR